MEYYSAINKKEILSFQKIRKCSHENKKKPENIIISIFLWKSIIN